MPASFANRPVSLRVYPERIVIALRASADHHNRSHRGQGQTVYDWRHYLAVIQRKPCALRTGAPFVERPGGDQEMAEILALVLHHDEQAVLCAVELALGAGAPTKTHVLSICCIDWSTTNRPRQR